MKLEHYLPEKFKEDVRRIVAKHVSLNEVELFVFGSRVDGSSHERSDIDVGIYRKDGKDLGFLTLGKIKDEIENLPILYKVDFVDFAMASDDFRKIAFQKIEKII